MKFTNEDQIKYTINVRISGIDKDQYAILSRITSKNDPWNSEDDDKDFNCIESGHNQDSIELVFERKWKEISEASLMKFCKEIMQSILNWKSIDYIMKDFTYFLFNMVCIWDYEKDKRMEFRGKHDIDYEFFFKQTKINPDTFTIEMNCDEINTHHYFGRFDFNNIYNLAPFIMVSICHDHHLKVSYDDIDKALSYVAFHAISHPDEDEIVQDIKFETVNRIEFTGKMRFKLERRIM